MVGLREVVLLSQVLASSETVKKKAMQQTSSTVTLISLLPVSKLPAFVCSVGFNVTSEIGQSPVLPRSNTADATGHRFHEVRQG